MIVHIFLCTWHPFCFVGTWLKRQCFRGGSLCFFANWERTHIERITSGIVAWVVVSCFLLCSFLMPVLCFRSARRSVMMLCCVFVASRKFCAPFFSAGSLLGSFWAGFSVFFMSWTQFLAFGRPAVLLFCIADALMHTFVPAGAARPPTRRQIEPPRWFFIPPLGPFSDHFLWLFRIFRNYTILWKLSPCLGKGSILKVQAAPNVTFSPLEPLPKIRSILEAHDSGGGGPRGKTWAD